MKGFGEGVRRMTEKRFEIKIGEFEEENIVDNLNKRTIREISDMCKKMNELHEENIKIKKNCNRTHKQHAELIDCVSHLGYSVIIRNGKVSLER
jgi:hypothetical protein